VRKKEQESRPTKPEALQAGKKRTACPSGKSCWETVDGKKLKDVSKREGWNNGARLSGEG